MPELELPLVASRSLLDGTLTVNMLWPLASLRLLAGDEGGRRPVVDRDDDMVRSGVTLSDWIRSVIKAVARWAAERRGREDMAAGVEV